MARNIYTDLAMEARELNPSIPGIEETNESKGEIGAVSYTHLTLPTICSV